MDKQNATTSQQPFKFNRSQLVTLDDLEQFKEDLLLAIKGILQNNNAPPTKKWLKSYEVKKMLNISTGTLQHLRQNGTLPHTKIGGSMYYDADDLNKLMHQQKQSLHPIAPSSKRA